MADIIVHEHNTQ